MSILDPTLTPELPASVAAERDARIAADADERDARMDADAHEQAERIAGDQAEAAARIAADAAEAEARARDNAAEAAVRKANDSALDQRLDVVESMSSVCCGAQTTRLTHLAGARHIADIGSDGAQLVIVTAGAHRMSDGDYVEVVGTSAYNGRYGPIDVTAADELRASTTIAASAHETSGDVCTAALRVEDAADFLEGIWLEVVNDYGRLHVARCQAPIAPNIIHLVEHIPVDWFDEQVASVNSVVGISSREVVLARTAAPGSESAGMTLPQVIDVLAKSVAVEFFGADPYGVKDSAPAFQEAVDYLSNLGGGGRIVAGGPGASYLIMSDVVIRTSNVVLDGLGALVVGTSTGRFYINGDSGVAGNWSNAVRNSHIVNWRIGTNYLDPLQVARAPRISWGIECSIRDVVKESASGTAITLDICQKSSVERCVVRGVRGSGGQSFGFLLHMCDDCRLERCLAADSPFYYAFQVKGGNRNLVEDCLVENVVASGTRRTLIGFRDRGSAPYHAAALSTQALTYPYPDVGWATADPRRESRKTRYLNCHVINSTIAGFVAQEGRETEFIDCSAENTLAGLALKRTLGDIQARLTVDALVGATVLTIEMEVDSETGVAWPPFTAGSSVVVELEGGFTHSTTAATDQVGSTLTISVGLPVIANAGRGLGRAQVGQERDHRVHGFRVAGSTTSDGVRVIGASTSYLPGVALSEIRTALNKGHGIFAIYTDRLKVERARALNNGQGQTGTGGILVNNWTRPAILDCVGVDDQAVHTQQYGIQVAEANSVDPVVRGCYGSGNTTADIRLYLAGSYGANFPGEGFAT